MRSALVLSLLVAGPLASLAQTLKFAAVAKKLTVEASPIPNGEYYIKNAKSGLKWAYEIDNESLFVHKAGSPMKMTKHGKYMAISPSQSRAKCASAQWDFSTGSDWAAVLYACVKNPKISPSKRSLIEEGSSLAKRNAMELGMSSIHERNIPASQELEKRHGGMGPVRGNKQLWIMRKCKHVKHGYHFITSDHLEDQNTKALASVNIRQKQNHRSQGIGLKAFNENDKSECWYIYTSRGKLIKRDFQVDDDLEGRSIFGELENEEMNS